VLGDEPRFDLFNPQWPIYSSNYQGPVARVVRGDIDNSLLGAATVVHNARIRNSIVRREAVIEDGAEIDDCIIMDYARIGAGARLRRTIVDRHNLIERGARIGEDPEQDRENWTLSPSGVVVVPRGRTPYFARGSRGFGIGYSE
jgi:glucose-1-phosphate adenylyltransferase